MKSIRAGGIVLNSKNQIALSKEHGWGFPRGGVEEGESLIEAAKREILEEVGVDKNLLRLDRKVGVYRRYPNGITKDTPGSYPMEIHIFLFNTEYTGELFSTDENNKAAKWVNINDVVNVLINEEDKKFFNNWLNTKIL